MITFGSYELWLLGAAILFSACVVVQVHRDVKRNKDVVAKWEREIDEAQRAIDAALLMQRTRGTDDGL